MQRRITRRQPWSQDSGMKNIRRPLTLSECLHDGCPDCGGTGRKEDGTMCIHYLSCPCPKCTPRFM